MHAPADLIRRRTPDCQAVAGVLPCLADPSGRVDRRVDRRSRAHVEQCLRCQAEVAGYRRMLRTLRELRCSGLRTPAPERISELLAALEAVGEEGATRLLAGWRIVYVGGAAMATAAAGAAAGVLVWRTRRRLSLAS
ncbi:MAG: hypothetical protein ACYC1D_11630 [Acidimicrobiales bacterium]